MDLRQSADETFLSRGGSDAENIEVKKMEDSSVFSLHGKKYIDFVMGWCVGNLGWGNNVIKDAIKKSQAPDYVYPMHHYKPWGELGELLSDLAPGKLKKCFRATGGSEAVDIALQIAMVSTKRGQFLSIEGSYHGNTLAGLSVGASRHRQNLKNLMPGCHKISPPLDEKAARKIEARLKKRETAAVIMEPVICNLGVIIPEKEFMTQLQELCKRYGTLLIMDEVATGFGRTGKLFASEHFGLSPDLMCLAKAITGGYAPMGATIVTEAVAKSVEGKVKADSTYGWHPLSVEAALANLRHIEKNRDKLLKHVITMSHYFENRLLQMEFTGKSEVRIKGLAISVELEDSRYAEKIQSQCQKEGLLLGADEELLTFFPALSISQKDAEEGLDILEQCL